MTITTIYHVSVDIPDAVHEAFWNDFAFNRALGDAIKGNIENSYQYYHSVEQIAEFHSLVDAKHCEHKLNEVVKQFSTLLKDK